MNEDSSTAKDNPGINDDASNPNDLDFEMTPEQEQEYVAQILKDGEYVPPKDSAEVTDTSDVKDTKEVEEVEPKHEEVAEDKVEEEIEDKSDSISEPKSDDLWIEVEKVVTDEFGESKVETVKLVYDPEDPTSFIPEDFTAKSTKQLADIMEAKAEMAEIYKNRKNEFDEAKNEVSKVESEKELLKSWDTEIADLIEAGVLTAPTAKKGDPDYGKDPAVAKIEAVFEFMAKMNDERTEGGKMPITSFGTVLSMYDKREAVKQEAERVRKEDEDTKKRGSMVGGSSASSGGSAETPAYKSGSYNNIWSVPVE